MWWRHRSLVDVAAERMRLCDMETVESLAAVAAEWVRRRRLCSMWRRLRRWLLCGDGVVAL
jgi:hypothetical protein